jgi:hypothetical protein
MVKANMCSVLSPGLLIYLSDGIIGMDNDVEPDLRYLYLRPCYVPLYLLMLSLSNVLHPERSPAALFVFGTPGCGKSLSRPYCCHRILNLAKDRERNARILFQKGSNTPDVYVVSREVGQEPIAFRYSLEEAVRLKLLCAEWQKAGDLVISLVDVSDGDYKTPLVPTEYMWYFTSPNRLFFSPENSDRWKRHNFDLFMPIWSWREYRRANRVLGLNIPRDVLSDRHSEFHGSARGVLSERGWQASVLNVQSKLNQT